MSETENKADIFKLVKQIKSSDGKSSLLEHLTKLYETKMQLNDDSKFLDLIEDISIRIKQNGIYFNEEASRASLLNYLEEFEKNSKNKKNLLGQLIKKVEGAEPEVITQVNFVPEYHNIFRTLEWVGISIGEKESYLLTNSLRNLVNNRSLTSGIAFWGKIYGREKDYYIAEALGLEANQG